MRKRSRVLTFGGSGLLVVVGVACGVVIGGGLGQILALVLIGIGLVWMVSLVFYEVGLTEDHERAREAAAREAAARQAAEPGAQRPSARRLQPIRRLDRMRGRSRRLR